MRYKISSKGCKDVVGLAVFNIVLRSLWVLCVHPAQQFDFLWYYTHAVQLANNQGYVANHHYTAYWPMGYPYFLSLLFRLFGANVFVGLIANILLSTAIAILVYLFARRLTSSGKLPLLSAVGYSLLPSQVMWNSVLGSEELATFLTLLALYVYLAARPQRQILFLASAGCILGVACDVRPIPLFLPVALFFYEGLIRKVKWRQSARRLFVLYAGVLLGICPLVIRNYIALHHFVLISTNGGVNLWQGTMTDGAYFWSWDPHVNPLLAAGTNEILENSIGTQAFLSHLVHHPLSVILHGFLKWFFLYWVDWNVVGVTIALITKSQLVVDIVMGLTTVFYWAFMVFSGRGMYQLVKQNKHKNPAFYVPLIFIAYNTAVFFFFPAWDRFRYPLMPMFAVYLGVALQRFQRNKRTQGENGAPCELLT